MLMTPARLIALRLFNISLGRLAVFNRLLRKSLVKALISKAKHGAKYNASSRFFVTSELD